MKTLILAGGKGTRFMEESKHMPKPMIPINGKPMIFYIMEHYNSFGFTDFVILGGTKVDYIINYFNNNFSKLSNDKDKYLISNEMNVQILDTGEETMTGGRVKRAIDELSLEQFMLTYGDGLSDVNINNSIEFHKKNNKLITVTAVHPIARFGELDINSKGNVINFKEKPQTFNGWINGGYFVVKREFIDLIDNEQTILEKDPLEKAVQMKQLSAFKHEGFWQCMDTKRDKDKLEEIYKSKFVPWLNSG